jgi:TRAP-type C4-dicarboxylate transport system permease small subunit
VGPDRAKHIRNILIIIVLALAVWLIPGGARASSTISNILSLIFLGGLLFFGYRLYMENRETIFGLEERQRGVLYAGLALIAITLVATRRMWSEGGAVGALVWLALIGAGVYALYGVWRVYREY